MSNGKNIFEETIKTTVNNFCGNYAAHLSSWLNENKNVEVTPEEICSCFDVPYKPPSTPGVHSAASIQTQLPNYYSGAVTPSKKKGGRTRKNIDPNAPQCEYTLSRGDNSGARCKNPVYGEEGVIGADRFCKACLRKAAVKKILEKPDDKPVVKPPTREGDSISCDNKPANKSEELSVVQIDGRPGFFKEENHGFIVEQTEDGQIITHAIEIDGEERELNDDERTIAINLGLRVANKKVTLSTNPGSTSIPIIPNVEVSI